MRRRSISSGARRLNGEPGAGRGVWLLAEADEWRVPYRAIRADAAYGGNLPFLRGLEVRHKRYVVEVPCDFGVQRSRRADTPVERADPVIQRLPQRAWPTLCWGQG